MKHVVLGVDIGGTFTKFGIVDREGDVLAEGSISTDATDNILDYQKSLYDAVEKVIAPFKNMVALKGIGIGAPNGNFYKGTIEYAPNLKWKGEVHFADLFKKYYPEIPILLTNDANAAAIGEGIYGGAVGMKDYIVITLGTGLGSGIVANGEMIYGFDGFAGELGHVIVNRNGRVCGCGRKGCLEAYCSATGLKRTAFEMICNLTDESELRQYSYLELTSEMIYDAAMRKDPLALEVFAYTGKILGEMLADFVAFSTPKAIFLFGGLAKSGELLLAPVREHFENNLLPIYRNKIQILPSGLQDKNIAVMGASALVWKELSR